MEFKVIYTSDLHGNVTQFKRVVNYAVQSAADALIIGGDIAPKGFETGDYISAQRRFFESELPCLLQPLQKEEIPVYLMMGNDDCAANIDIVKESCLWTYIHGKRIALTSDFDLVGYAHVPITPFGIKDWEKWDLTNVPSKLREMYEERIQTNYRLDGFNSSSGDFISAQLRTDNAKTDSIQLDMESEWFSEDAAKTVYVMHSPPNDTNLDKSQFQSIEGESVGSFAERIFIEQHQPYITLHGHIHETVQVSGSFQERIGETLSLTAGNTNLGEQPSVLVFDLYDPKNVERILV